MPAQVLQPHWQVTAPVVQDGKVVFTAPDSEAVHCIGLKDGKRLWSVPRQENDLYLGGVLNGKVLIVSKSSVRALSLASGKQLWELAVGLPSGQGVASGTTYYLPLRSATQTRVPEVCSIDVERGIVLSHSKSRKKEVPGNLIFADGLVISQSLDQIVAFPQLKVMLEQIDQSLKVNPNDPAALTERSELRLEKGDLQGAADDLRRALQNKPPREIEVRARNRLHETLSEYFQRDFNAAEKYSKEYEECCKPDLEGATTELEKQQRRNEARRRRTTFLGLIARGKETQGKLVEAFEKYEQFYSLAGKEELLSSVTEPAVRTTAEVWAKGRIAAMLSSGGEPRKLLEDRIAERWKQIQNNKSLDDLHRFVALCGSLCRAGKEARLLLAERLLQDSDPLAPLQAERQLYLLRDCRDEPDLAGKAVECLARLNLRRAMLKEAACYYRLLRRDFGKVEIRKGQTGADIFNELAADKRILPYLDEPAWPLGREIRASEAKEAGPPQDPPYSLGQIGEDLPFFQENQLVIRKQASTLQLLDRASGKEKWNQDMSHTLFQSLSQGLFQSLINRQSQPNAPRLSFQSVGHLVVVPLGPTVLGIDPIQRKVLWEENLGSAQRPQPANPTQLTVDPRDNSFLATYPDGWVQRLGPGVLQPDVLCLLTRDGLLGLDPLTGRTLWVRSDVSSRSHIFGDGRVVYVVETEQDDQARSTRAVRIDDGTALPVADFAALYQKRVSKFGRTLVLTEPAPEQSTLRLHDVFTGKDAWKGKFPAGSMPLQSEDPTLTGMIEPNGKVHVIDLQTHKEVLQAAVNPRHFAVQFGSSDWRPPRLIADARHIFLATNNPVNGSATPVGVAQAALTAGSGLRAVPVHGMLYCFDRSSGKLRWYNLLAHQMLLVEQFQEMPVLLFVARATLRSLPGQRDVVRVSVRGIRKDNGKFFYDNDKLPDSESFHALRLDAPGSKVELVGQQMKIVFHLNGEAPAP